MAKKFSSFWIIYKDIILEIKTKEIIIPFLIFSFLLIVFISFSIQNREFSPFIFWLSFLFSGIISLSRYTVKETNGGFKGLLILPIDRESIFIGKTISLTLFLFLSGIFLYFLFLIFLNFPFSLKIFLYFLIILFFTSFSFSSLGILISFLTMGTRAKEFFLPLIIIPLFIPPFISAISLTNKVLSNEKFLSPYLYILIFFSLLYFFLNQVLFEEILID
ncbi:MAG: heme exporter protein CcmB [candidate division WOR-3 bacterium]